MAETEFGWLNRKALVTGCTGFLGRAVVRELLDRGAEVVGLIRERRSEAELTRHQLHGRVRVVHGRVDDLFRIHSALAIHEIGAVFHLTGPVGDRRDDGTATVVEAVRRYDPRTPMIVARPTRAPRLPDQSLPVALATARFGEIFGEGDRRPDRVVPRTILGLMGAGGTATAPESEDRDFVFVEDAARACIMLAEKVTRQSSASSRDVTFASGWVRNDQQIAGLIREIFLGRNPPSMAAEASANSLGWSPELTLADALRRTIEWYRQSVRGAGRHVKLVPGQRRTAA